MVLGYWKSADNKAGFLLIFTLDSGEEIACEIHAEDLPNFFFDICAAADQIMSVDGATHKGTGAIQ